MPIIRIPVENPAELLNSGYLDTGALIRIERSATGGGVGFSEIGTVAIVATTNSYTYYDLAGATSSFYRVRYSKAGGTSPSSYGPEFQTGDETAGLLCSLYDVQQELGRTTTPNEDEVIMEKIRQVSRAIERATGRWLAPRPTDSASTTTLYFTTEAGSELYIPRGVRAVTALGIASEDQPATGGTYVTATAADYYISPPVSERIDADEPGRYICFRGNPTGPVSYFFDAAHGASVTGSFGYASVPPDIQGVATRASLRRFLGKGAAGTTLAIGPTGTEFVLPDLSGADRATIADYTRWRF